jgi:hypothetical protein
MSKLRDRLIEVFGEDEDERFKVIYQLIKDTSPQEAWALWAVIYHRVMRGDSMKVLARDFMYSNGRIASYFDKLIEKKTQSASLREELLAAFGNDDNAFFAALTSEAKDTYGWRFWLCMYHRVLAGDDPTELGRTYRVNDVYKHLRGAVHLKHFKETK